MRHAQVLIYFILVRNVRDFETHLLIEGYRSRFILYDFQLDLFKLCSFAISISFDHRLSNMRPVYFWYSAMSQADAMVICLFHHRGAVSDIYSVTVRSMIFLFRLILMIMYEFSLVISVNRSLPDFFSKRKHRCSPHVVLSIPAAFYVSCCQHF